MKAAFSASYLPSAGGDRMIASTSPAVMWSRAATAWLSRPVARGVQGVQPNPPLGEKNNNNKKNNISLSNTHAHTTKSQSVSQGPPPFSFEVYQIVWSSA